MHFKKAVAFAGAASAATSICDKYTTALLKNNTAANQYTLLTLLVNTAVIGNYTGPGTKNPTLPGSMVDVPGILASGQTSMGMPVNLAQYFDGSLLSTNDNGTPKSVNFLDGGGATPIIANATSSGMPGSAQSTLLTHLYQYFGVLLGCSGYGKTGFPAYAGEASQYNVHKYMDLDEHEIYYFISQVGAAAQSFGASMADISTVAMALNTTFGYRCAPAAQVVPGSGPVLNAICIDSDCPQASSADCSAYAAATSPAAVSAVSSAASAVSTAASGAISQISDGQPQATSPVAPVSTAGAAAVAATALPAAVIGLAGLAAMAL